VKPSYKYTGIKDDDSKRQRKQYQISTQVFEKYENIFLNKGRKNMKKHYPLYSKCVIKF